MVVAADFKSTSQVEFVNKLDERLECPICKNVFNEPWQTSCGHRFCRNCFGGLFGLENPKCPIDGEPISREDSFRDKCCEREVLNLQCFCRYKERSCDWKGEIRHCKVHEESCQYGDTKCAACNETMKRRHLKQHRENDCVNRAVACTYCGGEVRQSNMKDHMEVCLKFPISCIQNCGKEDILRGMMEEHVTTHCPKAEHLCHFSTHGCEFQGNAEQFSEHMKSSSESHLVMMNYSTQEQNKKIKEMEEKVSRLENEKRTFEQQIRSQTEELAAALQNIQLECNRQLDRAGHQMALHEIQLSQQDMQLQMLEATSYNGTYVWKIDHYSRRFQEAASGQTLSIHSPPFYVGRFGYKVCAHLYPNGDGVGKGTHMSMYFVIMRGEYDAILPWPFIQKVHFKLIDQERIRDAYDAFRPEPHSSSFKRPTSGMNIASGCPTFISHTELRQGGFIRNDTIFVKITVDMTGLQGVSTVVKPQPCTQDFP